MKIKLKTLLFSTLLLLSLHDGAAHSQTIGAARKPESVQVNTDTITQKLTPANLIAEGVKPSVVRVVLGCKAKAYSVKTGKIYSFSEIIGTGSGFFVNSNGYIVTNAHVTDLSIKECQEYLEYQANEKLEAEGKPSVDTKDLKWVEIKPVTQVYLPNGDKLPYKVITSGKRFDEGKDVSIIKVNITNAPVLKLATANQIKLGDSVKVIGYPGAIDLPELFNDSAFYESTFTSGEVAAKKALKDGTPVIQLSAPALPGNSGGPVVNEQGEVIGILTFGLLTKDNFNFAFTSNTIYEFLDKAGISNDEGIVSLKYREGLQLYSQGKYTQALQNFKLVKHLFPQHSEAEKFAQSCQQIIGKGL
ncbi:serine protease [Calothrix sp. HK-06]|nr:serine protease [Calothrix sp. HK-06]